MMNPATNPSTRRSLPLGKRIAPVSMILLLVVTRTSSGGTLTGPNAPGTTSVAGISNYTASVDPESTNPGAPVFDRAGELTNIGALPGAAGYGILGATSSFPVSSFGGGTAAPAAPLGFSSASQPPVPTPLGPFGDTIGSASTLTASTFAAGQGAGIFWLPPTFVADSGPIPIGTAGRASVVTSQGIASFTETAGAAVKTPGVGLAISGTLGGQGPAGAFVAASLVGTFSIFNPSGVLVAPPVSTSVIIVSDGPGSRDDFVTTFSPTGNTPTSFVSSFITPGANSFVAYGVSLLPSLTIPSGDTVQIAGTLTLVADPDVTLSLDILPLSLQLPDLGAFGQRYPNPRAS